MVHSDLQISLSTFIEVSSLLGLKLEDYSFTRQNQDLGLIEYLQDKTTCKLNYPEQKKHFFVSALDFLVYEDKGEKRFKFVEINGSGFTGITNVSIKTIQAILYELSQISQYIDDTYPLILIPCSGTREIKTSGRPAMLHEKVLFAQAIKEGYLNTTGHCDLFTLYEFIENKTFKPKAPTVIIGYLMDFMNYLSCRNGKIYLLDFPVSGATHDRFCDNVVNTYKEQIDINKFYSMNNLFLYTSDKGNAYRLFNAFRAENQFNMFDQNITHERVFTREELISSILNNLSQNKRVVIKPHGAALGRGIEFFVQAGSEEEVITKIDESIQATNKYCGVQGWAFPYTVVGFVDCCTIQSKNHLLYGHKFELRVLVYRENEEIKVFPSIVKIASKFYEPAKIDRLMLLNNVAAAAGKAKVDGANYILPLANYETLKTIGLNVDQLTELCSFCCQYVKYAVNEIHTKPVSLIDNYAPIII
jgi:hypothetical protein